MITDSRLRRRSFLRGTAAMASSAVLAQCVRAAGNCLVNMDDAYQVSIPSMGSIIDLRWISLGTESPDSVLEQATKVAEFWVDILSDYQQDSQCMQLCRDANGGEWVTPSAELWRVIAQCDRWYRISEGAFDASLGALTKLRRSQRDATEQQWQQARERCGWSHIEIDFENHRLRFERPGLQLDFGAIGKGFVVDRIGETMQALGLGRFLVNASGNMLCGNSPYDAASDSEHEGWPVAIGLVGHSDRELKQLRMRRCGIATSGDQYQRFRDGAPSEGRKPSSHIIDPEVRRGLEQSNMATVITRSASDADALATACCVHMQRGSINQWLARVEPELPPVELILQVQRGASIALTTVPCDW